MTRKEGQEERESRENEREVGHKECSLLGRERPSHGEPLPLGHCGAH